MMTLHKPQLSKMFQGVEFAIQDGGDAVRVVVTRDLLEQLFGASDAPESWVNAFLLHQDSIYSAAEHAYRNRLPCQRNGAIVLTSRHWESVGVPG